jgi:hypothetical protein
MSEDVDQFGWAVWGLINIEEYLAQHRFEFIALVQSSHGLEVRLLYARWIDVSRSDKGVDGTKLY